MNEKKLLTVNELKEELINNVKKQLLEYNLMQPILHQSGQDQSIGHEIEDQIGAIFIITAPQEGIEHDEMVMGTTSLDFANKISTGELTKESIRGIFKKETHARTRAKKILKEFNQNLYETRLHKLGEYRKQREHAQSILDSTNKFYEGRALDEMQTTRLKSLEETIKKLDKNINIIKKKIDASHKK